MMDGERSESEQSAPHDAFEWCRPRCITYVAFQGCLIDHIQKQLWNLSSSVVIYDFNISYSTRWPTVGQGREISIALIVGAFIVIRKGKEKDWHSTTPYISIPTQVLRGTRLYVALPTVWESRMNLKVKAVKEEGARCSRATCRSSGRGALRL